MEGFYVLKAGKWWVVTKESAYIGVIDVEGVHKVKRVQRRKEIEKTKIKLWKLDKLSNFREM